MNADRKKYGFNPRCGADYVAREVWINQLDMLLDCPNRDPDSK
jgi:hypothetical protein